EISRKDEIWQSESGLITIAGGKLTGYRKMAELVVDLVANLLHEEGQGSFPACHTMNMPISGGKVGGSDQFPTYIKKYKQAGTKYGLTAEQAEKLVRLYGSNIEQVFNILDQSSKETEKGSLPQDILAMVEYSLREEMVTKPADFFIRRTGALFFDIQWVQAWKNSVAEYMAKHLHWSSDQKNQYMEELEGQLKDAVVPIDNPQRNQKIGK
ncbi:MAG TPA: glycerol-3-phosphate dehydrogenase C-terminal domain-containing protein, partial [Bacillota bacterium]|nr:glycerol-3-phosphate dehydrogenase C-terminal domain-containing protein [Bacillota bacterium]